jgi:hypothetical protein
MAIIDAFAPRDFAEVLGSLLTAVLDAQARAARSTVDFIEEVGVEVDADDQRKLRSVSFGYRKLNEAQEEADFELQVPLLSLVQIPMVSIKTAKIEFSYDVHHVEENAPSPAPTPPSTPSKKPTRLLGTIQRKPAASAASQSAEETSGLKVTIELERGGAPLGIERLLDILELAVASKPVEDG